MKKVHIDRNRIKRLIYPTFGFPAIAKQDEHLTIEFDPRNRDWNRPLPQVVGFQVTAVASEYRKNRETVNNRAGGMIR